MNTFLKYEKVYSDDQEKCIAEDFKRIDGTCYLDHAGAALYSEKQMELVLSDLCHNIYANPHSFHISSKLTEDSVDIIRFRILQYFNTTNEEYSIVFTSGATQALKIVSETFNYGDTDEGMFLYLQNNHTSVLNMRNYAKHSKELKTTEAFQKLCKNYKKTENKKNGNSLFAYPAQCNFSGTKYPLEWIESVKNGGINADQNWYILLDAANFLSTDIVDLSEHKPDFVTISFYKIFGYPTGLGALLVKKSSEHILEKKYFGGGTVLMTLSAQNLTIPRNILHERFEDGTIPFLSIISLKHGFDTFKRLKLSQNEISKHTFNLAQYVFYNLITLHHSNGKPVAILYHDTVFNNHKHQGAIINFNILRENGEYVGYSEVQNMANLHGIHIRTGCHCNPGGCQRFLNLHPSDVIKHYQAGHVCGDQNDLIEGQPTGSVRISFGYMSTKKDADIFLKFIEDCFINKPILREMPIYFTKLRHNYKNLFYKNVELCDDSLLDNSEVVTEIQYKEVKEKLSEIEYTEAILEQIILYPIKSCAAFSVQNNWMVTKKGLKFDREWMIVNASGACVTQKHNKKLCLIQPVVNLIKNTLTIHFKGKTSIELDIDHTKTGLETYLCQSKVCRDRVIGWDCGDDVSNWLSENLEMAGLRLLRQFEPTEKELTQKLSFANQAQYLLVNSTSVEWLRNQVPKGELHEDIRETIARFRPNIVVKLNNPFEENQIESLIIDKISLKFSGNCTRCQMICIDQSTGEISKEPLSTLSKSFKGKINFGIYLNQDSICTENCIKVKSKVFIEKNVDL